MDPFSWAELCTRSPRCGRPMRAYRLSRVRAYDDPAPVCGRAAGHPGNPGCVTEETYRRYLDANRDWHRTRRAA